MKKALTAACAVTILVAFSAARGAASSSIGRGYRGDARGQQACRGAYRRYGDNDKVKAALLQDPGTAAIAIGVETLIGGVRLTDPSIVSTQNRERKTSPSA